ncbi:hypothetical protein [Agaribacter marinus]|uniref:Lipoprotein n=1 Tax=Agaribacter marinus TaxID=1431249 RepID=A0AA37SWA6_9ALTE|nr:hypothetical protein [Agaribacter marinus]GLR70881.1 hypothetical protein GCM10007852_17890 [Agaribacter marinus]
MNILKKSAFILFSLSSACSQAEQPENINNSSGDVRALDSQLPELGSFECIGEFRPQVSMLGRGDDYPNFIAKDITDELLKQDYASRLISATCTNEAQFGIKTATITKNGENQQVLDYLEATFPLDLVVFNGEENWRLDADIKYEVSGLVTKEQPELVKHFIVNQSYDMDGKVLKKIFVKE